MREDRWELPSDWKWVKLGDLIHGFEAGKSPQAQPRPAAPEEFGVLKVSAVTWGEFDPLENKALLPGQTPPLGTTVRAGDLLISRANTAELVGAVVMAHKAYPNLMLSDKTLRIVPNEKVFPKFLLHALRSSLVREHFNLNASGTSTSMRNLSQDKLAEAPIPLPPLDEQRRIVARLDDLLARARRAREALTDVPALLEQLHQSVLAAAFRGDLTAAWREAHPSTEPAAILLERIRAERKRHFETASPKKRYEPPVPVNAEAEGLPDLPAGWEWTTLDEVLSELRNGIATKPDRNAGLPILRISAVRPLNVNTSDVRFLSDDSRYDAFTLKNGDLLFTRYNGNADLVGACGAVSGLSTRLVYPDKLIRGRAILANPDFLAMCMATSWTRAAINGMSKTAAGQVGISGQDLKTVRIPLAPLAEQVRLVSAVQTALSSALSIANSATLIGADLDTFERAILAKAFRGELLEQEQPELPASIEPILGLRQAQLFP